MNGHLTQSQPSLKGSRVPPGHVIVNSKFQGTAILRQLRATDTNPIMQDGLGIVDFYPSSSLALLWLPEELLVSDMNSIMQKLQTFKKAKCDRMVLAQVTQLSAQYFKELQNFSAIEANIPIIPLSSSADAVKVIAQMVHNQTHPNPLLKAPNQVSVDDAVMTTVRTLPGVGQKKASELLRIFLSLHELEKASIQELESVVGGSTAQNIRRFLHGHEMSIASKK